LARTPSLLDYMRPAMMMGQMMVEAQTVIAMRLCGMAGGWQMAPGEHLRMITEKTSAVQEAGLAMARAMGAGAAPHRVAIAGMKPVRRRTKANVRRLSRDATGGGA
jgi:hypothetical protein